MDSQQNLTAAQASEPSAWLCHIKIYSQMVPHWAGVKQVMASAPALKGCA